MPFVASLGGAIGYGRASQIVKPVYAQWATKVAGTASEEGTSIARDSEGNVYMTGFIFGTVTISNFSTQPVNGGAVGLETYGTLTAAAAGSLIIVKYNSSGIVQWATKVDPISSRSFEISIAVDVNNNVIVTGGYATTSAIIYSYSSAPVSGGAVGLSTFGTLARIGSSADIIVVKYNSNGIAQWATNAGSAGTQEDFGRAVATDSAGNIFVAGMFRGPCTFNSFASVTSGSIVVSSYGTMTTSPTTTPDVFLVKYNPSGVIQWTTRIGGTSFDQVFSSIAVDNSDNICLHCTFGGTITLFNFSSAPSPPGSSVVLTAYGTITASGTDDICVAKYNTNGSAIWATKIGSAAATTNLSYGIATDSSGNIFVSGYIAGNTTISSFAGNPLTSGGAVILQSYGILPLTGSEDAFVIKYNSSGVAQWATRIAGTSSIDRAWSVACDQNNNVYVVGFMTGNGTITSFGSPPADGTSNIGLVNYGILTNAGGLDSFVVKYNPNGVVLWATTLSGTSSNDEAQSVCITPDGYLYVCGFFISSTMSIRNFLSPPSVQGGTINLSTYGTLSNAGSKDAFLVKFGPI